MSHELHNAQTYFINSLQNYVEDKNKSNHTAAPLYYGIVGTTDLYNKVMDRYHITIPELSNAYFQYVPRQQNNVGNVSQTLTKGDVVLISFQGGSFSHPLIVGTRYYTGSVESFINNVNSTSNITNIKNGTVLPPTLNAESLKALSQGQAEINVKTRPNNEICSLYVYNQTEGLETSIHTGKQVEITSGSKYTSTVGNQISVSESIDFKAKQSIIDISKSTSVELQTYLSKISNRNLNVGYQSSNRIVPGQLTVSYNGTVATYQSVENNNNNNTQTFTTYNNGTIATYEAVTNPQPINFKEINSGLNKVQDLLEISMKQDKYEQEALLPCIENIKNIWNAVKYLLGHSFAYSAPAFNLSTLCNLRSIQLKASFPPIGSIEQTIDYCAPAWLSVPLLVAQGFLDLACNDAWRTDFLSNFSSAVNSQLSLMICCDDNGIPTLGFNIASSIDINSKFAISGSPIPLRDSGQLPSAFKVKPNPNTTININPPNIIKDLNPNSNSIKKLNFNNTVVTNPNSYNPQDPYSLSNLEDPETSLFDIYESYGDELDLPAGLTEYDMDITDLNLILPTSSYKPSPYLISDKLSNTPNSNLIQLLVSYGVPQPTLLVPYVSQYINTNSIYDFIDILSICSQNNFVRLILLLYKTYLGSDLDTNKINYLNSISKTDSVFISDLFNKSFNQDLQSLQNLLFNYYKESDINFLDWLYDPIELLSWIAVKEPTLQPLFSSLFKNNIITFCILLVRIYTGFDLNKYPELLNPYISLCRQAFSLPIESSSFYSEDTIKVFIPDSQFI